MHRVLLKREQNAESKNIFSPNLYEAYIYTHILIRVSIFIYIWPIYIHTHILIRDPFY
jgi:hypothetical protein